jgi:hypothetical protein
MTNAELIDLLREAQETLLAQHDPEDNIKMANRIDAALAKSQRVIVKIEPSETPRPYLPPGIACPKCLTLLEIGGGCERCDAALSSPRAARTEGAEKQESLTDVMKHEKIEWDTLRTECYLPENDQFLIVEKEFPSQQYCWFVKGSVPEERLMQLLAEGCCATEAEAKEAAIAAARGMR